MKLIGFLILVIGGGFLLYSTVKDRKRKANGGKPKTPKKNSRTKLETVQDLLDYESINDRGIVKLKSNSYTAVIELTQINQHLNNIQENAAVWKKFRTMLNSIGVRHTYLVQSQYLDVMDFVNDYNKQAESISNLTPELLEAKEDVIRNYKEFAEQKTREYRAYMIFRFNPKKDGLEKGLETGNAILDNLLKAAKGQTNQMSEEEEQELAESILDEVVDLSYQLLHSIGSQSFRLNRSGVLSMTYATLNRDLAVVQRLHDSSNAHSFSEFKQSLTPFYFEEQLKNLEDESINDYRESEDDVEQLSDYSEVKQYEEVIEEERALQTQR